MNSKGPFTPNVISRMPLAINSKGPFTPAESVGEGEKRQRKNDKH